MLVHRLKEAVASPHTLPRTLRSTAASSQDQQYPHTLQNIHISKHTLTRNLILFTHALRRAAASSHTHSTDPHLREEPQHPRARTQTEPALERAHAISIEQNQYRHEHIISQMTGQCAELTHMYDAHKHVRLK